MSEEIKAEDEYSNNIWNYSQLHNEYSGRFIRKSFDKIHKLKCEKVS